MRSFGVIALAICSIPFWGGSLQAREPVVVLFELYVQSVVYPESFDSYVRKNSKEFDKNFFSHLDRVTSRISAEAREDIEACEKHANPKWFNDCLKDRTAAGMYFWCVSLRYVLDGKRTWAKTSSGAGILYAKKVMQEFALDYVKLTRAAVKQREPQLRYSFR